jgi:hypothetical protein
LLWTVNESHVLGIAWVTNDRMQCLYSAWQSGAMSLS